MQDFRKICTMLKVKPIAAIKFAEEKLGEMDNKSIIVDKKNQWLA